MAGQDRGRLIDQCKRLIAEAYEEATEMIVAYLEMHPKEPRQSLCKEIDPDNFVALSLRVQRLQQKRRSEGISGLSISGPTPNQRAVIRGAKSVIRQHPELAAELLNDPTVVRAVVTDRETNANLAKARQEYDQEVQDTADLRHPDRVPLRHASKHRDIMYWLTQVRRAGFENTETLLDLKLSKSEREEGQELGEEVGIVISRLTSAYSGTIDQELADAIEQWRKE